MLRPFRLIMLAALALGTYVGFFQIPDDKPAVWDFDPAIVAKRELEAWQAGRANEEFGAFMAHVFQMRELHRYTWFRAGQTGLDMAKTSLLFADLRGRYERVLPNLEAVATVEKNWKGAAFDPAAVARAQLNWMVTARMPNLNDLNEISSQMAEDYGLRYGMRSDQLFAAAAPRAEAFKTLITSEVDPDWASILALLEQSYTALQRALRPRAPAA
jgi:hypothetical protein